MSKVTSFYLFKTAVDVLFLKARMKIKMQSQGEVNIFSNYLPTLRSTFYETHQQKENEQGKKRKKEKGDV